MSWVSYDELNKKSNDDLLRFLGEQGAITGSIAGAEQERNRELTKAILDNRSANLTVKHNRIMIGLTIVIGLFTIVIAILTWLLYKKGTI